MRVYVAGAYGAEHVLDVFANMKRGIDLSIEVLQAGMDPFVPWLDYQFFLMSDEKISMSRIKDYSMAWLDVCSAVLVVPHSEDSRGTQAEIARARELGIPVFHDIERLKTYHHGVYLEEDSNR